MDLPDEKRGCHRTGFTRRCRDLVVSGECQRWMQVLGVHPNTGDRINKYNCIDDWAPVLMMENSKLQRETGAAIESFRNETVAHGNALLAAHAAVTLGVPEQLQHVTPRLINGPDKH